MPKKEPFSVNSNLNDYMKTQTTELEPLKEAAPVVVTQTPELDEETMKPMVIRPKKDIESKSKRVTYVLKPSVVEGIKKYAQKYGFRSVNDCVETIFEKILGKN